MRKSSEAQKIMNKLISELFKFFVFATISGFVVNFTSDGQTAVKKGTCKYNENKDMGIIDSMTLFILGIIDKFCPRQHVRESIPLTHNM